MTYLHKVNLITACPGVLSIILLSSSLSLSSGMKMSFRPYAMAVLASFFAFLSSYFVYSSVPILAYIFSKNINIKTHYRSIMKRARDL